MYAIRFGWDVCAFFSAVNFYLQNVKMKYTQHKNNTALINRQCLTQRFAWSWRMKFDRCFGNFITICCDAIQMIYFFTWIFFCEFNFVRCDNFSNLLIEKKKNQILSRFVCYLMSNWRSDFKCDRVYGSHWCGGRHLHCVNAPIRGYISMRRMTTRPFSPWLFTVYYFALGEFAFLCDTKTEKII